MKRDMELVRKILLAVEESDDARRRGMRPKIDGYQDDVIQAHVGLLFRKDCSTPWMVHLAMENRILLPD